MPSASFVFPVRYVSEGVAVQTTSRELSPLGIAVRSLNPPQVGARVSMALYLPNTAIPEVAIGRVAQARMRISHLLSENDQRDGGRHRTFQRVAVKLEVRFRTANEFVKEHALNLSRGGIFIQSDDPPPIDSAVEVEIHLPDAGLPVTGNGIVVHRQLAAPGKVSGAGVQFVDASDAFRERIDRFMETILKE